MSTPHEVETEVLVVGAGPSGATAAALLATYGIDCMAINKHASVANSGSPDASVGVLASR
ncbi:FAD-dependent monooxygenase [Janibacter sp. LM]|uniref:FAD-dependent monooxygenase n=1 Tax=Janibacter sp. LM TaxID=3144845 RepID=UPI0031F60B2A